MRRCEPRYPGGFRAPGRFGAPVTLSVCANVHACCGRAHRHVHACCGRAYRHAHVGGSLLGCAGDRTQDLTCILGQFHTTMLCPWPWSFFSQGKNRQGVGTGLNRKQKTYDRKKSRTLEHGDGVGRGDNTRKGVSGEGGTMGFRWWFQHAD